MNFWLRWEEIKRAKQKANARLRKLRLLEAQEDRWTRLRHGWDWELTYGEMTMPTFGSAFGAIKLGSTATPLADERFAKRYPTVWMFLSALVDDDGKKRLTSTLTFLVEEGALKMGLNDRQTHMSLWVTSKGVEDGFDSLERALSSGEASWRKSDWKPRRST